MSARFDPMQGLRLAGMVLALAGILYAVEFLDGSPAVWWRVALLGVGFMGLLVTFRLAQHRKAGNTRSSKRHDRR